MLIISNQLLGQNYIDYQRIITRINDDILNNDFSKTIERLDSIYVNYNFIFAKECVKALQICCYLNDSINVDKWLSKSFKQGIPLWIIRTNELTKKSLCYTTTQNTINKYDSLRSIYKASLNPEISKLFDSLYIIDQRYTSKVNDGFFLFRHTIYGLMWLRNNKREFLILNKIIDQYGYPGERLIGLDPHFEDSAVASKHLVFWGPVVIQEFRAKYMLMHYFSNYRKNGNDFINKLFLSLESGYIQTYCYADLNSFIYHQSRKKYGTRYYINKYNNDTVATNNARKMIGLGTVEQTKRMGNVNIERRKNKKLNSEIILE